MLSRTDALTGLLNRRAFVESQKMSKDQGRRKGHSKRADSRALLVIDLDHFKQVNDQFGHDAGDAILVQVADLFRINLRADDVVARLGGEEFAVALQRGTVQETWNVAQRLRQAVERNVFIYGENEIRLTISVGVVRYEGGKCFETALRQADLLTYKSKKDGRNRVSYVDNKSGLAAAA
nr:GGDEF domain-containing protein [Hoeflea prorocentri]